MQARFPKEIPQLFFVIHVSPLCLSTQQYQNHANMVAIRVLGLFVFLFTLVAAHNFKPDMSNVKVIDASKLTSAEDIANFLNGEISDDYDDDDDDDEHDDVDFDSNFKLNRNKRDAVDQCRMQPQ
ncbi:hypothetical protein HDE_03543 [Halotydeus destructor]|nr:hypothetical protein HDE_03543 [Halotydeus destructor]